MIPRYPTSVSDLAPGNSGNLILVVIYRTSRMIVPLAVHVLDCFSMYLACFTVTVTVVMLVTHGYTCFLGCIVYLTPAL